jgi:hypothetical protein
MTHVGSEGGEFCLEGGDSCEILQCVNRARTAGVNGQATTSWQHEMSRDEDPFMGQSDCTNHEVQSHEMSGIKSLSESEPHALQMRGAERTRANADLAPEHISKVLEV